jgi:hypothetical protein
MVQRFLFRGIKETVVSALCSWDSPAELSARRGWLLVWAGAFVEPWMAIAQVHKRRSSVFSFTLIF